MFKRLIVIVFVLACLTFLSMGILLGGNYLLKEWFHLDGIFLSVMQFILIAIIIFPAKFLFHAVTERLFPLQ